MIGAILIRWEGAYPLRIRRGVRSNIYMALTIHS
jgi:hypothetical protein